ncbi:Retinol dehydrogenase 7 [Bulinus truncatus]|nr:Retinol dehydrogenase 7 [Bulinus truncatus]
MSICLTLAAIAIITYIFIDHLLRRLNVGGYNDKYVVVTGCDSGFGQRLAERLDKLGFSVLAGCLTEDGRRHLSQICSTRVLTFRLDVRSHDSIQAAVILVKQTLPADKGIWGLVNNAGIVGSMAITELCTKQDYLACWDVNVFGVTEMTRSFLPLIRKSRGRVINTSSGVGRLAAFASVYTMSKFGVEAYSDILRRELYSKGVRILLVEPGAFKTPIFDVDKLTQVVQKSFDSATEEVRTVYGDVVGKFRKQREYARDNGCPNIDLVVDAYIHGLTSRFPRTRYGVGGDAKYFYVPMSYLPTWFTDWYFQYQ